MVTQKQLDKLRLIENQTMTTTAYLQRYTQSSDNMGSYTDQWNVVGTIFCNVWPMFRSDERVMGEQNTSTGAWYILVPYNTTVTSKDRFVIANHTFEVTWVPNLESEQTAIRCESILLNEELRV